MIQDFAISTFERKGRLWIRIYSDAEKVQAFFAGTAFGEVAYEDLSSCFATLVEIFRQGFVTNSRERIEGRGEVSEVILPGERTVVLRRGIRGGVFGSLLKDKYLRLPGAEFRNFEELFLLDDLFSSGVAVPQPLVALVSGISRYRSLIGTEKVDNAKNLFQLAREGAAESFLIAAAELAGKEAKKMLAAGVFHPDLHLGNVLFVDERVFLIDFDKACRFSPSTQNSLRQGRRLVERFSRFCRKYGIYQQSLSQAFLRGIGDYSAGPT